MINMINMKVCEQVLVLEKFGKLIMKNFLEATLIAI